MNKLAVLAGKSAEEFKLAISKLEEMSGWPSEDVRQFAQASQAVRAKVTSLGLDPDDTTPEELYRALLVRYQRDATSLERALNVGANSGLDERIDKAGQLVARSLDMPEAWALKSADAKKLIKKNPPKHLMKTLHYRSVDSLLKHEDIGVVFLGARLTEPVSWRTKLESQIAKLGTTAYELRPLKIVNLDLSKLAAHASADQVITSPAIGAAAVSPNLPLDTPILTIALLLLDGLEAMSEHSLEHRLHSVHPALAWWADAEHLSFLRDGEPVSFNYKDVARNHLAAQDFNTRLCEAAQHCFWQRLMSSYKSYLDELPREVLSAEQSLAKRLAPVHQLVPTLEEIEV